MVAMSEATADHVSLFDQKWLIMAAEMQSTCKQAEVLMIGRKCSLFQLDSWPWHSPLSMSWTTAAP